jgi:predicted N-formylglutamate amidohydrolase
MVDVGLVWKAGSEFGSLASDVLHHVGNARGIGVADNIPYAWTDTGARTMNLHGTAKGRNAVCIEVRNTLLTDVDDQPRILSFLTEAFKEVAGRL